MITYSRVYSQRHRIKWLDKGQGGVRDMRRAWLAWWSISAVVLAAATPVAADTTLTVDLATTIGPATHVASGSLYGVTETLPADIDNLIVPLQPNMFTNPAADVQQPVGDAIDVATRLAPIGARVTIRLADWFPSWPYAFTNITDWLDKLNQTVMRKQASGVDNYYGYEIWNEPDGTWTSSLSFNDFWKQSYDKLRQLDPTAKIIGPSVAWYSSSYLNNFLSFAKDNSCLPDIISWHELAGADLASDFENYRAMEQQLGIGPLPISINEYSGKDRIDDEGQPGASAPLIAKFERYQVDTACISYWDVPHPGRLGSLLATDSDPNGGWWFYKWYGEMSGNMVATIPPAPSDAAVLDGFANVDSTNQVASVLFGGTNDGTIRIVIKGFSATSFFGSEVHAVVEHTPFVNRMTAVQAVDMISATDLTVASDEITITVTGTNGADGYRVVLTPVGGGVISTGGAGSVGVDGGIVAGSGGKVGSGTTTGGNGGSGLLGGADDRGVLNPAASGGGLLSGVGTGGVAASAMTGGISEFTGNMSDGAPPSNSSSCACNLHRNKKAMPTINILSALSLGLLFVCRRIRRRP